MTADCKDDITPQFPLLERKDQTEELEGGPTGALIYDIIAAPAVVGGPCCFTSKLLDEETSVRRLV